VPEESLTEQIQGLRGDVRDLSQLWQQVERNEKALRETRRLAAGKADDRALRILSWISGISSALIIAGVLLVGLMAWQVRSIASDNCEASNSLLHIAITRELQFATTDTPDTRATHRRFAAQLQAQLRRCP
jgi:hypothetical protein